MKFGTRQERNHSSAECTSKLGAMGDALYVIGGKWKLRVIIALTEGNKRFNDLQRAISGISARVLSNELKELEINGFLKRNVYTEPNVVIEYELTEYSQTLDPVLAELIAWGEMHRAKIREEDKPQEKLTALEAV
ncbi:helix-turn-helix domain-containing protein [Dyadobacter sp. CY323]|uniref:winged helix-turn-helix transcriptional regulator n=1 Tax=Dyadobacter sp. CY323 TaxID=2907302 RepID=UPI001F339FA3|nr:helix-turn-helix domain-containing protein [Dyadobacter sp. CY323]MCE6987545.1 helix-turn-helix transcriptional regulator [Dyadobacter sp. CY323]